MDNPEKTSSRGSRWLKVALKIAVSAVCLWYVSTKIDFPKAGEALSKARWHWLGAALLFFVLSKVVSAIRLNIYFRNIRVGLAEIPNLKLYWMGMFYNLFLPGSVTGDAYKVILLTKRYGIPYKKTTAAVLLDRFSGLLGLGVLLAVYSWFVLTETWICAGLTAGAALSILLLYLVQKRWWTDFLPGFNATLLLGMSVQALQVICVYFIMAALALPASQTAYIFLFLVSSVVSVLPLTIGGIGIREVVFLEGSRWLGLSNETAVIISLVFYLVTLLTSSFGMIYVFRDPLAKKKDL